MKLISVHAAPNLSMDTASALAAMILHASPDIEYERQRLAAPWLAAENDELRSRLADQTEPKP